MGYVRIRNKDRVYLGHDPLQALDEGGGELLIPANVEKEGEVVHLEEVAVWRLVTAPGQGVQADDGSHPRQSLHKPLSQAGFSLTHLVWLTLSL